MIEIIHGNNLDWEFQENDNFAFSKKSFTKVSKGELLGTSLFRIPPQKKAFPFHFHYANEEAIYVLEGEGEIRDNKGLHKIAPGDYVVFPRGKDFAHQIQNNGTKDLVYLCFSTMIHPEVVEYPDSQKVGVRAVTPPGASSKSDSFSCNFIKNSKVDYFEGEK